jgi:hypothetical protein
MGDWFTLLPYARPGVAELAAPPEDGGCRLSLGLAAQILGDGQPQKPAVDVEAQLKGPGDVVGLDESAVASVEPSARTRGFEADYFPYVEFADPDLPWRYSLDRSAGKSGVQPWLALIALKEDEYEDLPQGSAPLRRIRVTKPSKSLPDPADLVWTAHVHLASEADDDEAVLSAIDEGAVKSIARMLCFRRLEEGTRYTLFLVPSYEQGRLAGIGESPGGADPFDKPTWTPDGGATTLPVYWSSRFLTNSSENLETLLRRLRALRADEADEVGAAYTIFAGEPGYYSDYRNPDASFLRQSATEQPGRPRDGFSTDPDLVERMVPTLEEHIRGEAVDTAGPDPLVSFPAHGWRYRGEWSLSRSAAERYWFDQLNLDLKFRDAAGLGRAVVVRNQDRFMKAAWRQYEEVVEANRRLAGLQTAERLTRSVVERRFARLPSDAVLALAEPLQSLIPVGQGNGRVLSKELSSKGVPPSYASRTMRRLAARRIRRAGSGSEAPVVMPTPRIPGRTDVDGQAETRFDVVTRMTEIELPDTETRRGLEELVGGALFEQPVPRSGLIPVEPHAVSPLTERVGDVLRRLPGAKGRRTIEGLGRTERGELGPVWRAPRIAAPLARDLRDVERDALLPRVDRLPDNTIAFFEENRAFIEAFMVGANHAFNGELRWRGFPTDMRGTVFRRFWKRGEPPEDKSKDDIPPVHQWRGALGEHFGTADENRGGSLIVVIRGDIVRKIGLALLELHIAESEEWTAGSKQTFEPQYSGMLGEDTLYYGFDISSEEVQKKSDRAFFVIYEPPGRLRFGLDVADKAARDRVLDPLKIRVGFPANVFDRPFGAGGIVRHDPPASRTSPLKNWDDFSWSHVATTESGYIDFSSHPKPENVSEEADYWGEGRTSASITRSVWQKPIAAILPLRRIF